MCILVTKGWGTMVVVSQQGYPASAGVDVTVDLVAFSYQKSG